jgi:hypothetical protein
MINQIFRLVAPILLLFSILVAPVHAQDTHGEIRALFERYINAWNQGDLATIGGEVYRPPIQIFDAEQTQTLATPQDIVDLLAQLRVGLMEAGFSYSKLIDVSICDLGGGLAFASFKYSRFDRDDKEMDAEPLASAYVVRRYEDGWYLAGHIMQFQPSTLSCTS